MRGIHTAATTNVDALIENAGQMLLGQVGVGIDGHRVAALPPDSVPLLKLHGCRLCDPENMISAPGQLSAQPVAGRIETSRQWLTVLLLNCDLVILPVECPWVANAILRAGHVRVVKNLPHLPPALRVEGVDLTKFDCHVLALEIDSPVFSIG